MGDRHDYVALDWVKGEIEEVLKQAQYELEAYVESPDDTARMKFCLTYLHQVRGTLQMVEFYGAAMLAEEMEAVAQAMLDDKVSNAREAREVLMQAILQLPNYLDHIKLGHRDLPVVLLPVLNDLRGARGESLLSETSFFQPNIKPVGPLSASQVQQFSDKQVIDLIRKLRQMYQVALLGVLKGKDTDRNIEYLKKVSARLAKLFSNTPAHPLWVAAAAVLEGISNNGIDVNSAIKELLKQLELKLKAIISDGPNALEQSNSELLKNLLFYIAGCEVESTLISAAKEEFNLYDALPSNTDVDEDRRAFSGPDKATMGSVATALIEEINNLKDQLDVLVQDKQARPEQLNGLLPGFKQISDTMGMLGLGTPRTVIQEQFETLSEFVSQGHTANNTELMDIAGGLLYVEASLIGLSDKFGVGEIETPEVLQLGAAQQAVLQESKHLIEQVKDLVVEYVSKAGSLSLLGDAAELMMNLRGTLIMVPQIEAANISRACSNIIQRHVDQQQNPDDVLLNALAEALSGIEYFIERLAENNQSDNLGILSKAREAILPFSVKGELEEEELSSQEENLAPKNNTLEAADGVAELEVTEPVQVDDLELKEEPLKTEEIKQLNSNVNDSLEELEVLSTLGPEVIPSTIALDNEPQNLASIPANVADIEPAAELEDEDDLIDDEIIEIFLEEAEEVLETILESWPAYKANNQDDDALSTTRRAFHTLKGSGRMVGALEIGETAWSIESMFNRLLDRTIDLSQPFLDIVDHMVDQIPALIKAFEIRQPCDVNIEAIQNYAYAIANGKAVDDWNNASANNSIESSIADEKKQEPGSLEVLEPALLAVFSSEIVTHICVIQDFIDASQQDDYKTPITDNLQRALHTLKGSAHMARIEPIAEIAATLESFSKVLCAYHVETSAEIVHLFIRGKDLIDEGFSQLESTPFAKISGSDDLTADIERLSKQLIDEFHQRIGTSGNNSVDPQVLTVFLSEGMDILLDAESIFDRWQVQPDDKELIPSIIDEIQTLEKGAQMAELLPVVTLCQALQGAYHKTIDEKLSPSDSFIEVIKEGQEGLLNMMDRVAASQTIDHANDLISELTAEHEEPESLEADLETIELNIEEVELPGLEIIEPVVEIESEELDLLDPELSDITLELDAYDEITQETKENELDLLDSDFEEIQFLEPELQEATAETLEFDAFEALNDEIGEIESDEESMETLELDVFGSVSNDETTGFSESAELELSGDSLELDVLEPDSINPVADMIDLDALEPELELDSSDDNLLELDIIEADGEDTQLSEPEVADLIAEAIEQDTSEPVEQVHLIEVPELLETNNQTSVEIEQVQLEPEVIELEEVELNLPEVVLEDDQPIQPIIDSELLEIFLEEAQELIDSINESLGEWKKDKNNLLQVAELQRDLHTFKGGARMAEINSIGDLIHELEHLYDGLSQGRLVIKDELFDLLILCHDRLASMIQGLKISQGITPALELITAIQLYIAGESLELPDNEQQVELISEVVDIYESTVDQPVSVSVADLVDEADAEVAEIFMDEAEELMEDLDGCILAWQADPENSEHNEAIQRVLHTLKGGAFMAGLTEIGNLSHNMESELQSRLINNQSADNELFHSLHQQYDLIAARIDNVQLWLKEGGQGPIIAVSKPVEIETPEEIGSEIIETAEEVKPQAVTEQVSANEELPAEILTSNVVPLRAAAEALKPAVSQDEAPRRNQPQEMIKVSADLLDGLVNLAGETSISRGRLENQVTDFSFTLEEMDATLDRLKDQLRRLDIETEAQVLFRQERHGPNYEDFDPLEMDRYSQLQQLSRSLVESASDLMDLKGTLLDKTRDAETLLLQQSRVNTELQEGLMKTRMVPFSRLVPRLRRIVRQISQELGKQVELQVNNAEGEMDRSVLERLISPLEHMLRNAVDHGLESTLKRQEVGKPDVGSITLSLFRDGGDVVLKLSDDGAGINLEAVRKKAIDRGLLSSTVTITDQEALQFILQAGFSTAEKVTQISGRGVGMDVVNSEIKQVGGSILINSESGAGTEFVIRLPFTVSVNRALMSKVGEALFAIPLNSIEGIVRVSSATLLELYKQENPVYQYAGRDYPLKYLGDLLRNDSHLKLTEADVSWPVVLVRGSQPAAIQVDALMGSREIVVKTLGSQFSSVVGVSGGTILGDGSVVIILDLPNMMRHVYSLEYQQHVAIEHREEEQNKHNIQEDKIISVLVVDDSVTVRKVTTRLLERNGIEVRTAKDGVDAMEILLDYRPDVMLLDIEMPRMDGFEVATQMRHDSKLKDVPIIMITSRTGDKHKQRAMAIGVTDYMGKPFQEDKLLGAINHIVGNSSD
ncbi:MAG: Hpt domain-containing protein [Bermanella sp.]